MSEPLFLGSSQVPEAPVEILVICNPDNDQGVLRSELTDLYEDYESVQLIFDFESTKTSEISTELLEDVNPDILFLPNLSMVTIYLPKMKLIQF